MVSSKKYITFMSLHNKAIRGVTRVERGPEVRPEVIISVVISNISSNCFNTMKVIDVIMHCVTIIVQILHQKIEE